VLCVTAVVSLYKGGCVLCVTAVVAPVSRVEHERRTSTRLQRGVPTNMVDHSVGAGGVRESMEGGSSAAVTRQSSAAAAVGGVKDVNSARSSSRQIFKK